MEPEKSLLKEFFNGGWLIPFIGAIGMTARMLSSNHKFSIYEQVKKIITAAISSGVAWFILEQTDIGSLYKAITYGIIGVISPEIIAGIVKIGQSFAKNPISFFKQDK